MVTTAVVPANSSVESTFCGNANYQILDTASVDNFSTTANYKGRGVTLGTSEIFAVQSLVTITPDTGSCLGYKYTTVGLSAVEVVPPQLSLPRYANSAPPSNPANITYTASATDACGHSVPVTCSPASGSTFSTGGTTVTCSASNSSRTATGSFVAYNPVMGYPSSSTICGVLLAGQGIPLGSMLNSCSGKYSLKMQGDSNLVLYNNQTGAALWATGIPSAIPSGVYMQGDGNLVTYSMLGSPLWGSGTNGHGGANLNVQDDGNVVIYQNGNPIWATGTNGR